MFSVFFKKKITEDKLMDYFVISTVKMVDDAFEDVAEIISCDPEFKTRPIISKTHSDPFLWIVIAGNLNFIPRYFNDYQDIRLAESANRKFARVLDVPLDIFKSEIKKYNQLFSRLNHPSKNTLYAMSKAVFNKYHLGQFQDEYFKKMDAPNPVFLKRLDAIMEEFIFDWEQFVDDFKIVE
tara:strand:+ start:167181 stop:167723 length:543 start_codon:yes stop_codon:yes gene_type:complete